MAKGRRKWQRKREWQYATILELVLNEDIYLVNYYGFVFKMNGTWTDFVCDRLTHVGQNAVGIMFGGCLVIPPADVAVKNLGYLRPVGIPRRHSLVTGKGTRVYDVRKGLEGLYDSEWTQVSFDKAAREFWDVVGEHGYPKWQNTPLFKFLMLETVVDLCQSEE